MTSLRRSSSKSKICNILAKNFPDPTCKRWIAK